MITHREIFQDGAGNVVADALVYVYVRGTSQATEAQLYTTADVAQTQPLTTDSAGAVEFRTADGIYDYVVSKTGHDTQTYTDIQIYSGPPYWYDIRDYGALGSGDDTSAIQDAIDAAEAAGGEVVVPAGTYSTDGSLSCDSGPITIRLRQGSELTSSSTSAPGISVSGADGFVLCGEGKLTGPGKGTAASGCYGVALTSSSNCRVEGVEISGFYHGIRPDDSAGSEDNNFLNLYIHDCAFAGVYPKNKDKVIGCRFKDIGTALTHHGCYINTAVADGIQLIGNSYDAIAGAGVHVHLESAVQVDGATCVGETMTGCGWGYVLSVDNASAKIRNANIVGATILDSVDAVAGGHGVHLVGTSGSIESCHIQASVDGCAGLGFNGDTSNLENIDVDVMVGNSGGYNAKLTADGFTGRIVSYDGADVGVYMNASSGNSLNIKTNGNASAGLYMTGACEDNFIEVYATDNTGKGVEIASASSTRNRVVGVSQGNNGADVDDGGTGNDLSGLSGASGITDSTADDATPSVLNVRVLSLVANSGATAITALDDGYEEQIVTLVGASDANSSTIADSGNFQLTAAWTAADGATLTLLAETASTWIELGRTAT